MAARRHARKVAYRRGWAGAAAAALWMTAMALPIGAATTEYIVVDRNTGLAIHGYDPVAYFTDGAPVLGKGEFEHRHAGVVWRFRNPGNLAAFAADPEVYMPRFGGYDPVGLGRNVPIAGDPRIWLIEDGRLYLFQSAENKAIFAVQREQVTAAADEAWPAVQKTLVP
jgi:YHS domain-containing protein